MIQLKILFVLGFPNPFAGAGWARISFFAKSFSNNGYDVDVLGTFIYSALNKRHIKNFSKLGIFNIIFNMQNRHPFFFSINSILSFIVSTIFLLIRKPNITIVSFPSGDVGLGSLLACRLIGIKCVVDYRDEWEDYLISVAPSRFKKLFYSGVKKFSSYLYSNNNLVITVTPNYIDVLRKRGVSEVKLIPNGADSTIFTPSVNKHNRKIFTLLYSGGIGGYYRLDVIIYALKKLVDNGFNAFKLVVAGAGEVQELKILAKKLELLDKIEYIGSIDNVIELVSYINDSDVGLIPYDDNVLWKNSLPAKFFEYCSCGIPVIATAHQDSLIATIIKQYRIGVTVEPMNPEELADSIYSLCKNNSFRHEAGNRGRLLIKLKFDRNNIATKLLNLLKEIQ